MSNERFSLQEANQTDLVDYLKKVGYQPKKIRNNDYWYLSPLWVEKTPSFQVNRRRNVRYDFGTGQCEKTIDFGILYHKCNLAGLLKKLPEEIFPFHQPTQTVQQPQSNTQKAIETLEPTIKLIAAKPLTYPAFCRYLDTRKSTF